MSLEKLKATRELKKINYQDMADAIGISKSGYWMIENGKRGLSYALAVKIASALGKTPDDLFLHSELTNEKQEATK